MAEQGCREHLARITPLNEDAGVDLDALYQHNLLSGMVNALSAEEPA